MEQMHATTRVQTVENARPESDSLTGTLLFTGLLVAGFVAVALPQITAGTVVGILAVVGGRHLRRRLAAYYARRQARQERRSEAMRVEPTN